MQAWCNAPVCKQIVKHSLFEDLRVAQGIHRSSTEAKPTYNMHWHLPFQVLQVRNMACQNSIKEVAGHSILCTANDHQQGATFIAVECEAFLSVSTGKHGI